MLKRGSKYSRLKQALTLGNVLKFGLPNLIVIAFCANYIFSGNMIAGGDFDYFSQLYEAFRASVLEYHQFPWWNPWMAGGTPLFANPQFGLVSIQAPFVLLFGTLTGLKLAFVLYYLIGFWGMYIVARRIGGASYIKSILIGFIWIFCGFFSFHGINHYTFALFQFFPWLFYFLVNRTQKYSWLWFGGIISLIILSSPHYALLMCGLVLAGYWFFDNLTWRTGKKWKIGFDFSKEQILFIVKVIALVGIIGGARFLLTYINISDFPRPEHITDEPPNYVKNIILALFIPVYEFTPPSDAPWGWGENSMYMGVGSLIALILVASFLVWKFVVNSHKKKLLLAILAAHKPLIIMTILAFGCFLLALGDHGPWSPAMLLQKIPGFTEMRVFPRWAIVVVFWILLLFATVKLPKKLNIALLILLSCAVVELFITFRALHPFEGPHAPASNYSQSFEQYDNGKVHSLGRGGDIKNDPYRSYYYATTQNRGQIYADDALVNTYMTYPTKRCGINVNPNCTFVLTSNAHLVEWSPNKFVVQRTAPGEIEINANPSNGWVVNGERIYDDMRQAEPELHFNLPNDDEEFYSAVFIPKHSIPGFVLGLRK